MIGVMLQMVKCWVRMSVPWGGGPEREAGCRRGWKGARAQNAWEGEKAQKSAARSQSSTSAISIPAYLITGQSQTKSESIAGRRRRPAPLVPAELELEARVGPRVGARVGRRGRARGRQRRRESEVRKCLLVAAASAALGVVVGERGRRGDHERRRARRGEAADRDRLEDGRGRGRRGGRVGGHLGTFGLEDLVARVCELSCGLTEGKKAKEEEAESRR